MVYSKNFYLCIVTSKDKIRTNLMLGDVKKLFSIIQCPQKNLIGKPYPDQILNVIKKLNVKKKIVFILEIQILTIYQQKMLK